MTPSALSPASSTPSGNIQECRSPSHAKHSSRVSIDTKTSIKSHKEYLDSLTPPTPEMIERINTVQEHKEMEAIKKKLSEESPRLPEDERSKAVELIQRNYRGHRERRALEGKGLDASTRWVEAIKEAQYRNLTQPRPRSSEDGTRPSIDGTVKNGGPSSPPPPHSAKFVARQNWKKIGLIARRAGGDEDSDEESGGDDENLPDKERDERRKRKAEEKMERAKAAKIMDLQYFLEMVDLKHRYGSNLRTYHSEWKKADTNENFFYWLDYGEGRYVDCSGCPRERLDLEQVRYLSKEERLDYLVKIDPEGRLCWAKNGQRIDTTVAYKDSIHGIVPDTDDTPAYAPPSGEAASRSSSESSFTDPLSPDASEHHSSDHQHHHHHDSEEAARADKYATPEFDSSRGMKKVKKVSAATIFNKLLRGSVKKNTWIFVADTSFRLYVGIKQSGAFQHSSFLHGSRISAAGLIKIKDGRLSKLSPLSGHYRPPVSNFRAFVHSLKDAGADMSHVSISRSYAVLVGLEAYVKTRRRGKKLIQKLIHGRDKLLDPDEAAKQEEAGRDKSESAARERKLLEDKQKVEDAENKANMNLLHKLDKIHLKQEGNLHGVEEGQKGVEKETERGEQKEVEGGPPPGQPGEGLENAIAPEGTREAD